ncbi:hypothetical protein HaLaN_16274, partial [Haematococcus lacustris]
MAKKQRNGTDKQKKDPAKLKASHSPQGKQRQERRNDWGTKRRQVAAPALCALVYSQPRNVHQWAVFACTKSLVSPLVAASGHYWSE